MVRHIILKPHPLLNIKKLSRKQIKKYNNGYSMGDKWFYLYLGDQYIGQRWIQRYHGYDCALLIEVDEPYVGNRYGSYLLMSTLKYHEYTYLPSDAATALYKSNGLELVPTDDVDVYRWRYV